MLKGSAGDQLRLFEPAKELMSRVLFSTDVDDNENMEQMWDRKLAESKVSKEDAGNTMFKYEHIEGKKPPRITSDPYPSSSWDEETPGTIHGAGIHDSLRERGYDGSPLNFSFASGWDSVDDLSMSNGHHRLAAAADLDMDVPVSYRDRKYADIERENIMSGRAFDVRLGSQKRAENPGRMKLKPQFRK